MGTLTFIIVESPNSRPPTLPPSLQVGNGLGEHLETILRNLLSKLHRSTTPSVVQSLMTVILYLIHTQLEPILSFLEQVSQEGHPYN